MRYKDVRDSVEKKSSVVKVNSILFDSYGIVWFLCSSFERELFFL